jgi:hypothetical protein
MTETVAEQVTVASVEARAHQQLAEGMRLVGLTDDQQLAWLYSFAKLLPKEFVVNRPSVVAQLTAFLELRNDHGNPFGVTFNRSPTRGFVGHHLEEIHRLAQEAFQQLADHGHWLPNTQLSSVSIGLVQVHPHGVHPLASGSRTAEFVVAVAGLFSSIGRRLRICDAPNCGRFFAATRPHQLRCSDRCTNKVTAARYRAKHAEDISAKRHDAYVRKVRHGNPKRRPGVGGRKKKAPGTA